MEVFCEGVGWGLCRSSLRLLTLLAPPPARSPLHASARPHNDAINADDAICAVFPSLVATAALPGELLKCRTESLCPGKSQMVACVAQHSAACSWVPPALLVTHPEKYNPAALGSALPVLCCHQLKHSFLLDS